MVSCTSYGGLKKWFVLSLHGISMSRRPHLNSQVFGSIADFICSGLIFYRAKQRVSKDSLFGKFR